MAKPTTKTAADAKKEAADKAADADKATGGIRESITGDEADGAKEDTAKADKAAATDNSEKADDAPAKQADVGDPTPNIAKPNAREAATDESTARDASTGADDANSDESGGEAAELDSGDLEALHDENPGRGVGERIDTETDIITAMTTKNAMAPAATADQLVSSTVAPARVDTAVAEVLGDFSHGNPVTPNRNLFSDLGMGIGQLPELRDRLNSTFGISLLTTEVENFAMVKDVQNMVKRKIAVSVGEA